jgi:hypothetical protein
MMMMIIIIIIISKICTRKPDEHIYVQAVWKKKEKEFTPTD